MTKLTLLYRDLTHGGCLDSQGVLALGVVLLAAGMMAVLAWRIWRQP